jgi:FAD synthetase
MPSSPPCVNFNDRNGESHASITPYEDLNLPEVCARIHGKVEAFLHAEPKTERVRAVQTQTRRSLNVIEEALRKYRYVGCLISL